MPPLKGVEQASFGGVDSRSNPVTMPQNRFISLENWRPRPDGHLELRDGYELMMGTQSVGGGRAYSLCPYIMSAPETESDPPADYLPPTWTYDVPRAPSVPQGTRCILYWQVPEGSIYPIVTQPLIGNPCVTCTFSHVALSPQPALAVYNVENTDPFTIGAYASVSGVNGEALPPWFPPLTFNGSFHVVAIDPSAHTVTLDLGIPAATGEDGTSTVTGVGGQIEAQYTVPLPGVPQPYLISELGGVLTIGDGLSMLGNPIASPARWHYGLGQDGFLYMFNGTDAKFFDGVAFRDVGLPTLTQAQLGGIQVSVGFQGPPATPAGGGDLSVSTAVLTWGGLGSGSFPASEPITFYYAYLDLTTNLLSVQQTPIGGGQAPLETGARAMVITDLPVPAANTSVGLIAVNINNAPGASFLTAAAGGNSPDSFSGQATGDPATGIVTVTMSPAQPNLNTNDVVVIDDSASATGGWHSNGPFGVTILSGTQFTFTTSLADAAQFTGQSLNFRKLYSLPNSSGPIPDRWNATLTAPDTLAYQGITTSSDGYMQLGYADQIQSTMLAASEIGGAQPGYQFYVSIYDPITGHVGNRVPIGQRLDNNADCVVAITGLPDFTQGDIIPGQPARYGRTWLKGLRKGRPRLRPRAGQTPISMPEIAEWRLLIGRTGDGGEVPYACTDSNGNWIRTTAPNQASINIASGTIDGNSELPTENYVPPPFVTFWREGDRMCGTVADSIDGNGNLVAPQPFVYRSGSELDATTGIFVGDPAQAWSPAMVETFPTAEGVIAGFGYMGESWVFTENASAQLSELSGEIAWNGPYLNFGIAGPWAFDSGWQGLPFWLTRQREIATMMPSADGPMTISTEYEAALLSQITDDSLVNCEVIYFRDPGRLVEVLRIKGQREDDLGNTTPFATIHDFHLRDDNAPYGQGYLESFEDILGPGPITPGGATTNDYTHAWVRDANGRLQIWAGGSDGAIYQLYTGGDDNGTNFTADAVQLCYMGGEHTATKTVEWYGDELIVWYINESMLDVVYDPTTWVKLSDEMRPVPGDARSAHYMADLQRPEMTHCYLWMQLTSHPQDAPDPDVPMAFNTPPHLPLETYGRLYMSIPVLGDSRGR